MKLYAISGLGADQRVFQYLTLNCELIPLEWIEPKRRESIKEYAIRLSERIDVKEEFGILGVSFGGLVAVEISKWLNPKLTILISSAETKNELRRSYRLIGKIRVLKIMPKNLFNPPRFMANWIFGAKNQTLLKEILNDTDLKFAKWAVNELVNWNNNEQLSNDLLKIGGTNDKLIPPKGRNRISLISGGTHFMIVDRANEISQLINQKCKKI